MKFKSSKVFLIGETKFNYTSPHGDGGLIDYFKHIGAVAWFTDNFKPDERTNMVVYTSVDTKSHVEKMTEVYSRLCYRSYGAGLNKNVTKIREGAAEHLMNVIQSGHGSVMEHAVLNFVFADVSRVLTHELVRHRVGVAISQESLRYVRLTDLGAYLPDCFRGGVGEEMMRRIFTYLEEVQLELANVFGLDDMKEFSLKKKLTSAMRRLAPIGLTTTIGWSANIRTLRHVIPLRTSEHAEEEIRIVFSKVGHICKRLYPTLFQDFTFHPDEGNDMVGEWKCEHPKI